MNTVVAMAGVSMAVLCAVPVFVILFAIISRTLRRMPLFDGNNVIVLALCVTMLCMIGLHRVFVQPPGAEAATADDTHRPLDFLLLPYTVMALAMLLAFCFLLLPKVVRSQGYARLRAEIVNRRERLAALRDSSRQAVQDAIPRRSSRSHDEGRCGPVEHSNRLKELRTDLQKKET
jgi:NADH:ubiquinone oxidoreductase subunit 5 (subunit L)/multisubunit Na+/H+ antiporter MnhA subunit